MMEERRNVEVSIATLEVRMLALEKASQQYHRDLKEHMDSEEASFIKLWDKIDTIVLLSSRYGGIATGIAIAVSSLWAVGIAAYSWVRH